MNTFCEREGEGEEEEEAEPGKGEGLEGWGRGRGVPPLPPWGEGRIWAEFGYSTEQIQKFPCRQQGLNSSLHWIKGCGSICV